MTSPNPNQAAGLPAYDENALLAFFALCRSYSEIKTYESARDAFFDMYGDYQVAIAEGPLGLPNQETAELYIGPKYKSKKIITENQDKDSAGSYFDYNYTEFKNRPLNGRQRPSSSPLPH